MASVSRVLETSGCGVQWRAYHTNLISIIPALIRPDIPCPIVQLPVALQYLLYGYGRVLWLVWIFDASVFLSVVSVLSLLCLATELSAEVPPTADAIDYQPRDALARSTGVCLCLSGSADSLKLNMTFKHLVEVKTRLSSPGKSGMWRNTGKHSPCRTGPALGFGWQSVVFHFTGSG